jgi:hypothetical protein
VPLGTYQGWNPRNPQYGDPDHMVRFEGSFWLFPLTEDQRRASGDPRRSVASRYPTQEAYVNQLKTACDELVRQRFLLPESTEGYLSLARAMAWPPVPSPQYPYWAMKPGK